MGESAKLPTECILKLFHKGMCFAKKIIQRKKRQRENLKNEEKIETFSSHL